MNIKINILNNLNNINFNENIENYVSSGKSLHVLRPKMRKILYSSIVINQKKKQFNIKHKDIWL